MPSAYDIDVTVGTLMTADELFELSDDGWRYELVRGQLRKMTPPGAEHGQIAMVIGANLFNYVRERFLGTVYASETGFRVSRNPDTVLAPDVAFVRSERIVKTTKYFEGPPDVVVEVISPTDTYTDVDEKTREWLAAGVQAVIIVNPRTRSVRVHRSTGTVDVADILEIDDVIPGWRMRLDEIFE